MAKSSTILIAVLDNDFKPSEIDKTTVEIVQAPANGNADPDAVSGRITYRPASGFVGIDSFTYRAKSKDGIWLDPATVTVTVREAPTNDTLRLLARAFVRALYVDILERQPDQGGLDFYSQKAYDQGNSEQVRREIVQELWHSLEHYGLLVESLYRQFLHRGSDPGGRSFYIGELQSGRSQGELAVQMLASPEYETTHADVRSFIIGLYRDVLVREPDPTGLDSHIRSFVSRTDSATKFLLSPEYLDRLIENSFRKYLQRGADPVGRMAYQQSLAGKLSAADDLPKSLMASNEYFNKAANRRF
jgi:hypothetical protein